MHKWMCARDYKGSKFNMSRYLRSQQHITRVGDGVGRVEGVALGSGVGIC